MPNRPFRFVHASDFHLEQPSSGISEVPGHLRELLLDAAYIAAERVIDTALAEDAELVVFSGDILQSYYTGPRGPLFLVEQFARLAHRGIAVYWAGGSVDPSDAWPTAIALPENVRVFPRGRVEEHVHRRAESPLLRISGIGYDQSRNLNPHDFDADPSGLYTIAAAHGDADAASLQTKGIDYWALGGRHERSTLLSSPRIAHYPGTPQGRCPSESGVHGCTLVQVDEQRQARLSFIPTDAMRWLDERIAVSEATTRETLEDMLRERMRALVETAPTMVQMISWKIAGSGALVSQLRRGNLANALLDRLRAEFGMTIPGAWSVAIDVEYTSVLPPEWYEHESIRGDFLRAIRQFELSDSPLGLECYASEKHAAGTLAPVVSIAQPAARQRALREAALLGVDLLGGEQDQP
jgi:DNA repair protein SbcD/Mre11